MTSKKTILTILASFLITLANSQVSPGLINPLDTFKVPVGERDVEEVNVPYYKRVHRVIDTRQKQNMVVNWPQSRLFDIIHEAALQGPDRENGIPVYSSDSLYLGSRIHEDSVYRLGGYELQMDIFVDDGTGDFDEGNTKDTAYYIPLEPENVKKFRILEDWIFDKKYSDFRPHIIAIAPLYNKVSSGVDLGEVPLYWVMMKDLDPILAKHRVYNPQNDTKSLSYEQWFDFRMFSSYVVGETNVFGLDFKYLDEYRDAPMEQLFQGERVEDELFKREEDFWEY